MRPWLVLLVGVWIVAWPLAVRHALRSPWAALGEAPSAAQMQHALDRVRTSTAVGVPLPALGCALAAWGGRCTAAVLLGVGTTVAVLVSALLHSLAG